MVTRGNEHDVGDSRTSGPVVLAGGTGDLGARIAAAIRREGGELRALVRERTDGSARDALEVTGATVVPVDLGDAAALSDACRGASVVVSALNGLRPTIIDAQRRLVEAAVTAGVPRFIPSDYSLDYTKTRAGDNRNMDLRREFATWIDGTSLRPTSILNGPFAELLTGGAPIVLDKIQRVLYWGEPDRPIDFTTKDDVAAYTACAVLDDDAPRRLRIAGDVQTPISLAALMTELTGKPFKLLRGGGLGRLGGIIRVVRTIAPQREEVFPVWQGMQYLRDMASGLGKLDPLDNDRYGKRRWTSVRGMLSGVA